MKRVIIDIFLFLSVFILPWWLVFLLGIIALFAFHNFFEILFLGFIIDSLYNASVARFFHVEFVVTIAALCLFMIASVLRRRLRFYAER